METTPIVANNKKNWLVAVFLSVLVGPFGIDRFYLGKIGTGILKLITVGGFGIWWIIDMAMIVTRSIRGVEWDDVK